MRMAGLLMRLSTIQLKVERIQGNVLGRIHQSLFHMMPSVVGVEVILERQ